MTTGRLEKEKSGLQAVPPRPPRKIIGMKIKPIVSLVTCLLLGACALRPTWHWEKPGASEQELDFDQNQCKAKVYSGNAGVVTNETVRKMFICMEAKGWKKVDN